MHKNSYAMIDEIALSKKVEKIPLDFIKAVLRALETIDKYSALRYETYTLPPRKAERLREDLKDGIPIEFMDITVDEAYVVEWFLNTIPLQRVPIRDFNRDYSHVRFDHNNHVFNFYKLPFHSEIKDFLIAYLKKKSEKWWNEADIPEFDVESGKITLGDRSCQISLGAGNQMAICEAIFSVPIGNWALEVDIAPRLVKGAENQRAIYDAVRAINKAVKSDLNIEDLVEHEALARRVRVNRKIFE
jgi:hypothetical protein